MFTTSSGTTNNVTSWQWTRTQEPPSPQASVAVKKPKPRPRLSGAVAAPQVLESDMQLVGIEFMPGATKHNGLAIATLETANNVISVKIGWNKPVRYATFLRGIFKLADQGVAA
jgi:hypothetical protein